MRRVLNFVASSVGVLVLMCLCLRFCCFVYCGGVSWFGFCGFALCFVNFVFPCLGCFLGLWFMWVWIVDFALVFASVSMFDFVVLAECILFLYVGYFVI